MRETLVIEPNAEGYAHMARHSMSIQDPGERCLFLCALLGASLLGQDILAIAEGTRGEPVFHMDEQGLVQVSFKPKEG